MKEILDEFAEWVVMREADWCEAIGHWNNHALCSSRLSPLWYVIGWAQKRVSG